MIIYFSGFTNLARPEVVFGPEAYIMLSHSVDVKDGKPSKYFRRVINARRKANGDGKPGGATAMPGDGKARNKSKRHPGAK